MKIQKARLHYLNVRYFLIFSIVAAIGIIYFLQIQVSAMSLWSDNTTVAVETADDDQSIELGVKFTSSVAGSVTGVKFYKSAANTGTHVGSLWDAHGKQLAKVTFSNETESGWQTATFSSPVRISADTTYVVSYFAPNGHYAITTDYFSHLTATNGPLQTLASTCSRANGLYKYSDTSTFPDRTWKHSNYWVDVLFDADKTTTPAVVINQKAGTLDPTVENSAHFTITFSEDVTGLNVSDIALKGTTTGTASLTGSGKVYDLTVANLTDGDTISATVPANVAKSASHVGNTASTSTDNSVTYTTPATQPETSVWSSSTVPTTPDAGDASAANLGMKFRSNIAGRVTGVKFYKSAANTGTHTGSLWTATGINLGNVTFSDESASGWQTATFDSPIDILANTTYVVSYFAPNGHYSGDGNFFTGNSVSTGPLTALEDGEDDGNGVYEYASSSTYPNGTWNATNYWVDVVFQAATTSTTGEVTPDYGGPEKPEDVSSSPKTTMNELSCTDDVKNSTNTGKTMASGGVYAWTELGKNEYSLPKNNSNLVSDGGEKGSPSTNNTGGGETTPLNLPRIAWEGGNQYYKQFPDAERAGWANSNHFPIAIWWAVFSSDTEVKWDKEHGINTYIVTNPSSPVAASLMESNGMSWIGGQLPGMTRSSQAWVGDFLDDEVDGRFTTEDGRAHIQSIVDGLPDHNKIRYANYTSMIVNQWMADSAADMYVNDFTDTVSMDMYFYSVPFCGWTDYNPDYYIVNIPQSTCRSSASYGKMVDVLRRRDDMDGKKQPIWNFIENVSGSPAEQVTPTILTPSQVKGAAMNSIIHEARGIVWFNNVFGSAQCTSGNALRLAQTDPSYPCRPQIEAMGEVNNQLQKLAPVLNTQSYQWDFGHNLDTMLKKKGDTVYIFSMISGDEGSTPGQRTFTLPPELANTSRVTVLDEGRSIPVTDGKFNDTFQDESSYHIYTIKTN